VRRIQRKAQTNPAVEQKKNVKWSNSPWNPRGKWGKLYGEAQRIC